MANSKRGRQAPTGIDGLDEVLRRGLPRDRVYLIEQMLEQQNTLFEASEVELQEPTRRLLDHVPIDEYLASNGVLTGVPRYLGQPSALSGKG
jgi:hypothetical protein